jgi:HEPN domain
MRWEQGRTTIDLMLKEWELQKVTASREQADKLIEQAKIHLRTVESIITSDPAGAYQLLYDATRKSLVAMLENQGLRPTSTGGHTAVGIAATAQLDPPTGGVLRPFDRMRKRRNKTEYPDDRTPPMTTEEVQRTIPTAVAIIDLAERVLDQMSPY